MMNFVESKTMEFKQSFTTNIYKTISAFSNLEGGTVLLGVRDDGEIVGLEEIKKIKLNIENTINDVFNPRPIIEFKNLILNDKEVLEIKVEKGKFPPYFYKNVSYMRTDTSTVPMDMKTLAKYMLTSENVSFDELDIKNTALNFDYLEKGLKEALGLEKINDSVLITLGLKKDGLFNRAAMLLSDDNSISNAYIDIAKFKISTDQFVDRIKFEKNSLLKYYDDLLELFNKYYPKLSIVSVPKRIEKEQIPYGAFKEAILNAIIHRDYLIDRGIQISMYDYMIEINSPGGLPEGISKEVFLSGGTSIPRNKVLASVFFRLGIIDQFGTGIKRIINNYHHTDEKPSFVINDNQIKIILPVIGYEYHKLNTEEAIVTYLKAHPYSKRTEIESRINVEKTTLLRRLNELIDKGLIHKTGASLNTTYYI
ncbi:MAG: RNA-binding domain-containing protein [Candidatus Caldatribacteriota bacterium]